MLEQQTRSSIVHHNENVIVRKILVAGTALINLSSVLLSNVSTSDLFSKCFIYYSTYYKPLLQFDISTWREQQYYKPYTKL
jgi:hypothetical protein